MRFANVRLQRAGRCHESEVFAAFRREHSRYRSPEALSDATLRDLVRNWHPGVERTPNGYYRNMSGERSGAPAVACAAPEVYGATHVAAAGMCGCKPKPSQVQQRARPL